MIYFYNVNLLFQMEYDALKLYIIHFGNCHKPCKNLTWILMKIPCHFMSQIDGSLVQIDTKFHDYSM